MLQKNYQIIKNISNFLFFLIDINYILEYNFFSNLILKCNICNIIFQACKSLEAFYELWNYDNPTVITYAIPNDTFMALKWNTRVTLKRK